MLRHRIAVQIAFFVNGFIYANWVSRLPRIQELYHVDRGTIALVLLASSIGAVGAMPFTGWVILKNGSRKITLLAALLYCAIVPLIPLMPNVAALTGLLFFEGIVTGMFDVAMNAQAVMVEQQYKRPIMTSFHALFSIGMALGGGCGALFTELALDLKHHFGIIVIIALIIVSWAGRHLIYDRPDPAVRQQGPLFRLPNAALISIGIITFCCMLGEGAMSNWSVDFMENVAKADLALAPIGLTAFAAAMTIGRIFGDKVRASVGDRIMIIAGGILSLSGLLLALAVATPITSILGFFFVGLGLSTIVPIAYSIAGNTKDLPSGVGLAMVTTVGYSGFLVGPPIIGFIADEQGIRVALAFVVILFATMTILGLRYKPKS